jgi:GH15 family glucan-1,4-alpha-glucosidase
MISSSPQRGFGHFPKTKASLYQALFAGTQLTLPLGLDSGAQKFWRIESFDFSE